MYLRNSDMAEMLVPKAVEVRQRDFWLVESFTFLQHFFIDVSFTEAC